MKHLYLLLLCFSCLVVAQESPLGSYTVDANYFYGNIIPHRQSIRQLITGHPEGIVLSFSKKTFGNKEWESVYNYPEIGISLHYQDMKNDALGEMYGLYGHYSFYFLNRNLMLRVGQGVAYNTNPYNKETNFRNYAYGAHLMPTTYFMLNYSKQNLIGGLGVQAGLTFIHHSNASMKSPNTSTNTFAVNVGVNYAFDKKPENQYHSIQYDTIIDHSQPLHFNFVARGGINQMDLIGSKQSPYYAFSTYLDKRISRKSGFQFGAEFFIPKYLKEEIHYMSVSYPEAPVDPNTDYHKVGVFAGYEMYINRLSFEAQVGAYVYQPYKSTGTLYQRIGLKYYAFKNMFTGIGLKTHAAKAEVMEFSLGYRL